MANIPGNVCHAIHCSRQFNISALEETLMKMGRMVKYRDVLTLETGGGEAHLFSWGIIIFWGVEDEHKSFFLKQVMDYADLPRNPREEEIYTFETGKEAVRIQRDLIALSDASSLQKLAISHALAQSLKLNYFEGQAQQTISETRLIPEAIAKTGKTNMNMKEIARKRGYLFCAKSDILLNFDLLDVPEFFWEYPELEPIYAMAAKYFEIRQRVEILSIKLSTIHELLEMLSDEQKHQHSSLLEWIIILLIAFEIVIFMGYELFSK